MDYICLAAGKGTRFGRLGRYLQKCMYPIGVKPFVAYAVDNLLQARHLDRDRDRLIFVIGHFGDQLRHYFGDNVDGLPVLYVEQTEQLGTGHAIHTVHTAYPSPASVVVWLADLYVSTALFEAVAAHPAATVQTLAPGPEDENPNVRVTTDGEWVTAAWQGAGPLYDIGLWKMAPDVAAGMVGRQVDEYRVLPNLQRAIDDGTEIGYVRADEWIHLGGTRPTVEENVIAVAARVLALEGLS